MNFILCSPCKAKKYVSMPRMGYSYSGMPISYPAYSTIFSTTQSLTFKSVGGGSINEAWQVTNGNEKFFCKINSNTRYPELFAKEAEGLNTISNTKCIQCPSVISVSTFKDSQILLLEWIEPGARHIDSWKQFGEQLAKLRATRYNILAKPA